ncbi:MAG: ATP-binding protein [Planctomycetota bacterium]
MSPHRAEGEASIVLDALTDVYAIQDVQEVVDRVCRCAVEVSPYRLALLSLYFGEDVYIGLEGGEESLRRHFLQTARKTGHERRAKKRAAIWANHRIGDSAICFIPAGSEIGFGPSYAPSPVRAGSEWQPDDRIMVFVRGVDGEVHGVLSLDDPSDGKRPDPENLGSLRAIDRLMKLMGVFIHNKHLEAKLRDSEARYAALVEQSHDGILIEQDGQIRFANRRMGRMLDTMPGLLIGKVVSEVITRDTAPALPNEIEGVLHGREGRTRDVSLRTTPIRFGRETANLISVQDITERKRIMERLQRSQKMESVGTLASGIAHDFNNLLGGILGYASLLHTRLGNDHPHVRYVESIESAAERASAVTRQLLGMVRDEQVRIGTFQVGRLLYDIADFLRETFPPSIRITVACDEDLPGVLGDEGQFHQVILNVCLNARDAMREGGTLALRAERADSEGTGEYLRISVSDSGTGVPPDVRARVFDPFFTTKEAGQGTGLGLYMAYRVVDRHGGRIELQSDVGEGTTVEILLPSSSEQRAIVAGPTLPEPSQVEGVVLLVDDEEIIRSMGGEMLERLGFEVVVAPDGPTAIDLLAQQGGRITGAIVDIAMPGMNGWEVVRALRALQPRLPIIVSSGHEAGLALSDPRGVSDAQFLKKPYRLKELNAVLAEVLAISRAGAGSSERAR